MVKVLTTIIGRGSWQKIKGQGKHLFLIPLEVYFLLPAYVQHEFPPNITIVLTTIIKKIFMSL
jgi:hypothetical protein